MDTTNIILDENCLTSLTEAVIVLRDASTGKVDHATSYVIKKFKELPVREATFTINLDNICLDKDPSISRLVEKMFPDTIQPFVREELESTFTDIEFKDVQISIVPLGDIDNDGVKQDCEFYDVNLVITISRKNIEVE